MSRLCIDCQHFVIKSWHDPYLRRHRLRSASKLFCCAATTFSLISSMRHVASSSSSFLFKKSFQLVTKLIPVPFFSLFICSCFFKHIVQIGFSFGAFFAALYPRNFFSFSVETSIHFPLGFTCSQASTELCPPLLLAGCCHQVFVVPYHSLLPTFHFSPSWHFSEPLLFSSRCIVFLLSGEHEDDCAWFLGQKGPAQPVSQIIPCCSALHHHLHQKRKRV